MQSFIEAIAFIPPGDTELFVKVALAARTLMPDDGIDVLLDWTKGTPQFKEVREVWNDCSPVSLDFVDQVFDIAEKKGWKRTPVDSPLTKILSLTKKKTKKNDDDFVYPAPNLPDHSLAKMLYDEILACSISPLPQAALGTALSTVGALRGGLHKTDSGLRTNLYTLTLALPGAGKSDARKFIYSLFQEIDAVNFLASNCFSPQGMHRMLTENPNLVFLWEEMGDALASMTGRNATGNDNRLLSYLMDIFSNEYSPGYKYARKGDDVPPLYKNCLSLAGIATPDKFFKSLSSDFVLSGFLPRFLIFDAGRTFPDKNRLQIYNPTPELKTRCSKLAMTFRDPYKSSEDGYTRFKFSPGAEKLLNNISSNINASNSLEAKNGEGSYKLAIQSRFYEHVLKVSLVLSHEDFKIIDEEDVRIAYEICEQNNRYLTENLRNKISSAKYVSEEFSDILSYIRSKKELKLSELRAKFQKNRELTQILEHLEQAGLVVLEEVRVGGRGRNPIVIKSVD